MKAISPYKMLGLLAFALLLCGVYVLLKPGQPAASAAGSAGTKQVRQFERYASEPACGTPAPNSAKCLAEISIGANGRPLTDSPASSTAYGPTQFHTAYQLPCTPGGSVASVCATPSSFGPETIAIVDAGNFSSGTSGLESSLQNYDQYYGLPDCSTSNGCLNVVNQSGATSPLPSDAGWSLEIALDVETAHMVCQTCKIVLVEADNAQTINLAVANATAASFNPVSISDSWGSDVDASSLDSDFKYSDIAVVASTGDSGTVGNGASWPSDIPEVVAASGTTLQLHTNNTWSSETVWSGSGGGCSTYYAAPTWQTSLSNWGTAGCGSYRAFGDVSADGDPNTGAAINVSSTWYQVGGTSLSSPIIASIFALAGGIPSSTTASSIPYTLYTSSNSHDITSGNDCTGSITVHCTAGTGFDTPSGMGSPNGITGFMALLSPATSLAADSIDQNTLKLTWTASSSSGVSGYYVYRDGTQIASVTGTTYTDTGLTTNASHTYYVVAYDSSSNLSGPSAAISAAACYPEDINEDTHINLLDLSLLASKYGQSGSGIGRSDINGDGTVNLLDLSLLASKYGSE